MQIVTDRPQVQTAIRTESWRDFRLVGTQSIDLADYIAVAERRRNTPPAFEEARRRLPLRPNRVNPIGHMLATRSTVHVADLAGDERYTKQRDPDVVVAVELFQDRRD